MKMTIIKNIRRCMCIDKQQVIYYMYGKRETTGAMHIDIYNGGICVCEKVTDKLFRDKGLLSLNTC